MIAELERLDGLAAELTSRARRAGVLLIWRAQCRSVRRLVLREGKPELTSLGFASGHGAQLLTPEGFSALASRDDFREQPALELLDNLLELGKSGGALGLARNALPALEPLTARLVPPEAAEFDRLELRQVARRLAELEAEIGGRVPGPSLQLGFRAELDAWRIFRSDGTDVLFAMPRCTLSVRATSAGPGARHGVSAGVSRPEPGLLWEEGAVRLFLRRAEQCALLARQLPDAPPHPPGSFPLVIDYALAKGLAHEAFGHAAEADGYRSSVLARDGRLRVGEQVGAEHVSVIDEPVAGDHAWQPFSANGLPRRRVTIVDHGRLREGLSDPFSAEPGGVPLAGSERAESFAHAPQPRMTNIRIEVDAPLAAPREFEEYDPAAVRELLETSGVLHRHPRVAYLSGYSGGQVNSASGDFAFNCKAIYALGRDGIELFQPAIFSGSMFGALRSVREAFGPLRLDAIGTCGKWGQSVPSSGGSHYFLVLDPDPSVRLGGT
ncbi:MAG TPA: TldD/PmbA family protein [Candidatus Polarisedimenticolaceae bacterium]|nr:TldD/PmbA family protein [Candidatus Polarisedimenticolaceae bacterium]